MKKILAILLAAMMTATAFAGCGEGGSGSGSGSGDNSGSDTSSSDPTADDDSADALVDETGYWVDPSAFGEENNITLKVWAPDKAVSLVKEQIDAFQKHYSDITFKSIDVVAQGEGDAATQLLNDPETAADVFSFASDQLNKLVNAGVISEVAFLNTVSGANDPKTVEAGTVDGALYAYPETNDNGYYLVYDNTVVTADQAKTLEGVLEACKAAGKKFIFDCGNGYYSCTFAFTAGVEIDGLETVGDEQKQKFTDYDPDKAVETLMAFSALMKQYKGTWTSLDVAKIASGFTTATLGAGVDGSWNTVPDQEALGDKFGAAKLPTINVNGEDKQLKSMFGYKYIGVNGSSKFPNAAQILALYLAGEECQTQRAANLGWGPSNLKSQQDKAVTDSAVLKAIQEQSANACAQVNIADTFWSPMGNLGTKLFADDTDPTDKAYFTKLLEETIKNIRDEA